MSVFFSIANFYKTLLNFLISYENILYKLPIWKSAFSPNFCETPDNWKCAHFLKLMLNIWGRVVLSVSQVPPRNSKMKRFSIFSFMANRLFKSSSNSLNFPRHSQQNKVKVAPWGIENKSSHHTQSQYNKNALCSQSSQGRLFYLKSH